MKLNRTVILRGGMVLVLAGATLATAQAKENGINGFSGINGISCSTCHISGLTPPTVSLLGPAFVRPGETATYLLRLTGGNQIGGGLDVAVPAGTLASTRPDTQILFGDLAHNAPQPVDANLECSWDFQFTAPLTPQLLTMYGAGNSVDLNGFNTGDISSTTTLAIEVRDNLVTFESYGTGVAGAGGFVPSIGGLVGPAEGGAVLQIREGLGGALGFLWIGVAQGSSFGFGGEFLFDFGQFFTFFALPLGGGAGVPGAGSLDLAVGDQSSLLGTTVYLQYTGFDAAGPSGFSFSNGTKLEIR